MAEQLLETSKLPIDERVLTEVNHLMSAMLPGGNWDQNILTAVRQNLESAVQEGAMPYAVTEVRHDIVYDQEGTQKRTFQWLGRSAVRSAMSGYEYHYHPNALQRVGIEVDEARDAQEHQRVGMMRVFISPRMSRQDADYEDAKQEHLADDDAVRVSWLETDEYGKETERVMQSLLVRNIPLSAWVDMLRDPSNFFGRSIKIEDELSALSVMDAHRELELPVGGVVQGPIDIVEAVLGYISDPMLRSDVEEQIQRYHSYDQAQLAEHAREQASDWLEFEKSLAESLLSGRASYDIRRFIISMQAHWTAEELAVIRRHDMGNTQYHMSKDLAVVLEGLKQNVVLGMAGATTGNGAVLEQLSQETQRQLHQNQQLIETAQVSGLEYQALVMQNQQLIAGENIKVGAGCPGTNDRSKGNRLDDDPASQLGAMLNAMDEGINDESEDRKSWKWKRGVCRVEACSTRPGETKVGPCDVCEKCQAEFDRGNDPTKQRKPILRRLREVSIQPVAEQKAREAAADKTPDLDAALRAILEDEKKKRSEELVHG